MASGMVTGREVSGEYSEEVRLEIERRILRKSWACLAIYVDPLSARVGQLSVCVDSNGARYWMLSNGPWWATG